MKPALRRYAQQEFDQRLQPMQSKSAYSRLDAGMIELPIDEIKVLLPVVSCYIVAMQVTH